MRPKLISLANYLNYFERMNFIGTHAHVVGGEWNHLIYLLILRMVKYVIPFFIIHCVDCRRRALREFSSLANNANHSLERRGGKWTIWFINNNKFQPCLPIDI